MAGTNKRWWRAEFSVKCTHCGCRAVVEGEGVGSCPGEECETTWFVSPEARVVRMLTNGEADALDYTPEPFKKAGAAWYLLKAFGPIMALVHLAWLGLVALWRVRSSLASAIGRLVRSVKGMVGRWIERRSDRFIIYSLGILAILALVVVASVTYFSLRRYFPADRPAQSASAPARDRPVPGPAPAPAVAPDATPAPASRLPTAEQALETCVQYVCTQIEGECPRNRAIDACAEHLKPGVDYQE